MLDGLYGRTSAVNKMIFDFWCFNATFSNISAVYPVYPDVDSMF